MAGDWIKMRTDLATDPAVLLLADRLEMDVDTIVGKLHRLWTWATNHCADGCARVALVCVDRIVCVPNFAQTLCDVGWLEEREDGISFPKFDRHMSQGAKRRALAAIRMLRSRCARGATKAQPEKRREEKSTSSLSEKKCRKRPVSENPPTVDQVAAYCASRNNRVDAQQFVDHYTANGWVQGRSGKPIMDWQACVRTWEKNQFSAGRECGDDSIDPELQKYLAMLPESPEANHGQRRSTAATSARGGSVPRPAAGPGA